MNNIDPAFDGLTPWPNEVITRYVKQQYWGNENLAQWLQHKISENLNNVVLSGLDKNGQWQEYSRDELLSQVKTLALGLQTLGIVCGDRIVIQMGNHNSFILTIFALFELGAIPVMALPGHGFQEIKHLLNLTQAKIWIASSDEDDTNLQNIAKKLEASVPTLKHLIIETNNLASKYHSLTTLLDTKTTFSNSPEHSSNYKLPGHQADPAGIALLLCSGGTTGLPKLIPRTHRDYIYNASSSAKICELNSNDCYLVALPAAHNFPLACPGILGAFSAGAKVVMCPSPSPDIAHKHISKAQATVTALVPPLVRVWLQSSELGFKVPKSLRLIQVGGARLDASLAKRVRADLGCELQQVFGMAEGLLNFTRAADPQIVVHNTQGLPLSELDEICIVDTNGEDVSAGARGELWTRGPYTLRGYYKDETANKKSFTDDGFYKTGDLVRQLSSGHIIVEGRLQEVIRRGAETVPTESLETCLTLHDGIQEAAVIGLPCERLGQSICAVLVLEKNVSNQPTLNEIRDFLINEGVAHFLLPESIEFIESLPLTAVGKIAHQQLISRFKSSRPTKELEGIIAS